MKTSAILALAGFVATSLAAAVPSAEIKSAIADLPEGTDYTVYPDGLPEDLKAIAMSAESMDVEKRQSSTGVYLCNDRNFSGYCVHIPTPFFQCVNLGGDLRDQVSSLGPDGSSYCLFYDYLDCQDPHFGTFAPGYPDLSVIGWNDRIASYRCNPN